MILSDSISTWKNVGETMWDVVVVGAGPAGGAAAAILAASGRRILLVEKSHWPRDKVCGGCLNAEAIRILSGVGLTAALHGANPISRVVWQSQKQSLEMPASGVALLRSDLDAGLVSSAIERGCAFLPGVAAKLLPGECKVNHRLVQLKSAGESKNVQAKMILACDGIMGTSVDDEPWAKWCIGPHAWIGASVTLAEVDSDCFADAIHMHIGRGGYVGMVRLPGGFIHWAAALDPKICRQAGGPAALVENILRSCGQNEIPDFHRQHFRGTGGMSRQREHLGGHRVLAVGDACGYVEPFTGEGMAWAIGSAVGVANLLVTTEDWTSDLPARWEEIHRRSVRRNQRWCRALRPMVHHPFLAACGILAAGMMPAIGKFVSSRIGESSSATPAHMGVLA